MNHQLKKLVAGLVMGLSPAFASVMASPVSSFSFYGTWRIDTLVGYSEISIDPDELGKRVGRDIVISPEHFRIADDDCQIRHLHESVRETTRLLLEGYKAGPLDAGVPLHTLVLQIEPCGDVFRAGNDIVVSQGGAFFRAHRVSNQPGNRK